MTAKRPFQELEISMERLRELVLELDEEMRLSGIPVERRPFSLPERLARRLDSWAMYEASKLPEEQRIDILIALYETPTQRAAREILGSLYPKEQLGLASAYIGAFLFKEVIYKLRRPMILGLVTLDLDTFIVGMPPERWNQLRSDPEAYGCFLDQCCDVADLACGFEDLRQRPLPSLEGMSRLEAGFGHLQLAANSVTGQISKDGIMHMIFLSAEVLLKGALIARGLSDKQMRDIGHKLCDLVVEFKRCFPASDEPALMRALNLLPGGVHERYEHMRYSVEKAGKGIMAAQFIGGEVVRALTHRNLRSNLRFNGASCVLPRTFP